MKDTIFLTGITGNLGSWLAGEMLRCGKRVLALVRNESKETAKKRLDLIFDIVGVGDLRRNVEIIPGDICTNRLGIGQKANKLPEFSKIVHCAACTKFQQNNEELSHMTNAVGTRNVLELASYLSVPVIHVSSAYIAGQRCGLVKEDEVYVGQSFNNVYERTKCLSETLVHIWEHQNSPVIILRPSIVMGDSQCGRIIRFNSMYDFIRVLNFVVPHLENEEIRIATRTDVTKNIIPVDYFAQVASYIIDRGIPGTYHITNPSPFTMKDLGEIFSGIFGLHQYKLVDVEDFVRCEPSSIERIVQEATSIYNAYMTNEPSFDLTNTNAALVNSNIKLPVMGLSYFRRLLDYARLVNWGRNHNITSGQVSNLTEKNYMVVP